MLSIGANGVYRLYRRYSDDHEKPEFRLIGVFAIVGGRVSVLEDHSGVVADMVPKGKLDDRGLYRLLSLEQSPYWRLVHVDDIQAGHHPDLLQEADLSEG